MDQTEAAPGLQETLRELVGELLAALGLPASGRAR